MNSHFQTKPEHKQTQEIQSFYEPALKILDELMEIKKATLRKRNHNEANAMVGKTEFTNELSRRLRVNTWTAHQIITSLVRSNSVIANLSFVKPKEGNT